MELSLDRPGDYPHVRHVNADCITVFDHELRQLATSFILTGDRVIENWPVHDARALTVADLEPLLAADPEVVILGTGDGQAFPPAAIMAALLQRNIGIEPMNNAAAARTHTVLAGEGRRVVAAFIL